ncbi:MAG TPA: 5-oxoprolinase subunit PxpA [Candidatus Limnocylindrales bacterium]|nr:5-oxoprolinase subunit PxpA [Candidatus Limnocylindrales bacterium]
MKEVDLNADVGEIDPRIDEALIPLITSANIACGGHAGDAGSMRRTVELARRHGVRVGAHPGYPDREHFGRRAMALPKGEVVALIRAQVEALEAVALQAGATVSHVKAHGALYNQAERVPELAAWIVEAVSGLPRPMTLVGRAQSAMEDAARAAGLPFAAEAFADRRYRRDGTLLPRTEPGAVLESEGEVAEQVRRLCTLGEVVADDGVIVPVAFETLCLHSDTPSAARLAARIRDLLAGLGVRVRPLDS